MLIREPNLTLGEFRLNRHSQQSRGLVGWWPDCGIDLAGTNHGKASINDPAGVFCRPWKYGGKYRQFQDILGNNNFGVFIPDNQYMQGTYMTLCAWVNSRIEDGTQDTFFMKGSYATSWSFSMGFTPTFGNIRVFIAQTLTEDGSTWWDTSGLGLVKERWYHIALTYDGTITANSGYNKVVIYVDGKVPSYAGNGTVSSSVILDSAGDFRLGTFFGLTNRMFNGKMRDVRWYNRALPAHEIRAICDPDTMHELYEPLRGVSVSVPSGLGTFTGTGNLTTSQQTLSGSATFTPPVYTGTGNLQTSQQTLSGSATHTPPVYTGAGAFIIGNATLSGAATFAPPVYTGSGNLSRPSAILSGSGTTSGGSVVLPDPGDVRLGIMYDAVNLPLPKDVRLGVSYG